MPLCFQICLPPYSSFGSRASTGQRLVWRSGGPLQPIPPVPPRAAPARCTRRRRLATAAAGGGGSSSGCGGCSISRAPANSNAGKGNEKTTAQMLPREGRARRCGGGLGDVTAKTATITMNQQPRPRPRPRPPRPPPSPAMSCPAPSSRQYASVRRSVCARFGGIGGRRRGEGGGWGGTGRGESCGRAVAPPPPPGPAPTPPDLSHPARLHVPPAQRPALPPWCRQSSSARR